MLASKDRKKNSDKKNKRIQSKILLRIFAKNIRCIYSDYIQSIQIFFQGYACAYLFSDLFPPPPFLNTEAADAASRAKKLRGQKKFATLAKARCRKRKHICRRKRHKKNTPTLSKNERHRNLKAQRKSAAQKRYC